MFLLFLICSCLTSLTKSNDPKIAGKARGRYGGFNPYEISANPNEKNLMPKNRPGRRPGRRSTPTRPFFVYGFGAGRGVGGVQAITDLLDLVLTNLRRE